MSLPIYVNLDFDYTETILNCTECKITQTTEDFQASLSFCLHDGRARASSREGQDEQMYLPKVRDVIRIKHLDGDYYDFKIESVSYSDGMFSVTAKYKAYEAGGVVNEPLVGMYTPKAIIETLEENLHGCPIDTSVSCTIDDEYCGIAIINPQLYRTSLYSQVIGSTKCYLSPYNVTGLKLVKSIGNKKLTVLSTEKDIASFSYSSRISSNPSEVIGYYKFSDDEETYGEDSIVYGSSVDSYDDCEPGEGELYDAHSDLENSGSLPDAELVGKYAWKKQMDSNPDFYAYPEETFTAELTPYAPLLSLGDKVTFRDPQYGELPYESTCGAVCTVSSLEYDALNEQMVSITAGDVSKNVSDIIASQEQAIEAYGYLDTDTEELTSESFDENLEHEFVVTHYNEGDVVSLEFDGTTWTDEDEKTHDMAPKISNIDGNVFTLKIAEEIPEDIGIEMTWFLRYIARTEHSLYDTGDLCDLTWTNYSTSYLSFDTAQISLKSGGAARACTNETISLTGYKRLVIEYELTTYKDTYVGLNTTVSTTTAKPNAFYCKLAKGGTKASVEIPDDYLESDELYLKIYALSGAVGKITKIYLQSK